MIINRAGAKFIYEGMTYLIGARILATKESDWEGLYGTITEIRDGADKDTENETPDIYCSFYPPVFPEEVRELEERFTDLYQMEKKLEDIPLDEVIMAPEMIEIIGQKKESSTIYKVVVDWAENGEPGHLENCFTDHEDAKHALRGHLDEELDCGSLRDWMESEDFRAVYGKEELSCYREDRYFEDHYHIRIETDRLLLSPGYMRELYERHLAECRREDMESVIGLDAELTSGSTDEQIREILADNTISERLEHALEKNPHYWESYWDSVRQVLSELIKEYAVSQDGKS